MNTTHHIVSVGVSLLGWHNRNVDEKFRVGNNENQWVYDKFSNGGQFPQSLMASLKGLNESDLLVVSAELSSLFKDPKLKPALTDSITLLHTETLSASSCAGWIEAALDKFGYKSVQCRVVEGLAEASAAAFYDKGLPRLVEILTEEIKNGLLQKQNVVLVPTGGYKAIIPYFVLMGILFGIPCRYVYERSDKVVTLPPLPLHADLSQWSEIEAILETVGGKSLCEIDTWPVYETSREKLMNLIVKDEKDMLALSPLCKQLQVRVTADRRRSELQFRTQNSPLLKYLEKDGDDTLRHMFLRLAEIGPYIWKGDRVPEMADHALLHHADLFHLAERILLPVFFHYHVRGKGSFLNPIELFVLLGALHLHDCGHVVGTVDLINNQQHKLLPTEVRDHHHVLGYLRLTQPQKHGGSGRWIRESLTASEGFHSAAWEQELIDEVLNTIATVGLYHRKSMCLCGHSVEDGKYPYPYPFVTGADPETIPSLAIFLEHRPLSVMGEVLDPDRIRLLVCLLRIIDSLDEQGPRTGGREAVRFHLEQLETERKEEEIRANEIRTALESVEKAMVSLGSVSTPICPRLDSMVYAFFDIYKKRESKPKKSDQPKKRTEYIDQTVSCETCPSKKTPEPASDSRQLIRSAFWQQFDEIFPSLPAGEPHPLRSLGQEYLMARTRAAFKGFQKKPYGEKLYIEGINIGHRIEGDSIIFRIGLQLEPEYAKTSEGRENRESIIKGMMEEYQQTEKIGEQNCRAVKKTLAEAGIFLEYNI